MPVVDGSPQSKKDYICTLFLCWAGEESRIVIKNLR